MSLTFKKGKYDDRRGYIYIEDGKSNALYHQKRVINWDSIPNRGRCKVYVKYDGKHNIEFPTRRDRVVNNRINYCRDSIVYIEVIK